MASVPWDSSRVKDTSVSGCSPVETFCTIMSTYTSESASRRKIREAMPGWSGAPTIVILAWLRS